MRTVTVQFLKNPDHLHWGFEAYPLGEDEWGAWMALPRGSKRWKGEDARSHTVEPAVFCAPREDWWHLHYNGDRSEYSHFIDICTPPRWVGDGRYEMIDLDLDVVRNHDGVVEVQDEDEFAEHQLLYSYTPAMIDEARRSTDRVVAALTAGEEPFFETADRWLAKVNTR